MSRNQSADKKKLLEKLRKMPIVEVACKQIGLPRATYYRWRKDDEVFAEACDEAIAQSADRINDLAESQLIAAIKDKNMSAITFWLKHHHPVYETRIKVDANVKHETEELTPEQAELVSRALSMAGLLKEQTNEQLE
ncbi:MAG TPA: phBC6A51 family helix-turn-helix protein [Candidatus Saccharimonadales bacterium]|nr:phBC6A51 family helix-turn-helix protein [Candidatus Saccharimonadales bacterium]